MSIWRAGVTVYRYLVEVLNQIGIYAESFIKKDDVVNSIINSIDNDKLVIIWIDCFYESIRRDCYNKNHLLHTLLMYGYNNNESTFNIIEHKNQENLSYKNELISYYDTQESYKGFFDNFKDIGNMPSYHELYLPGNDAGLIIPDDSSVFKEQFLYNAEKRKGEISDGLRLLKSFGESLVEIIFSEEKISGYVDDLVISFNSIINGKYAEIYKLSKLFGEQNDLVKLQQECLKNWTEIRSVIAKYKYSEYYKKDSFESIAHKLNNILDLEGRYFEVLIQ